MTPAERLEEVAKREEDLQAIRQRWRSFIANPSLLSEFPFERAKDDVLNLLLHTDVMQQRIDELEVRALDQAEAANTAARERDRFRASYDTVLKREASLADELAKLQRQYDALEKHLAEVELAAHDAKRETTSFTGGE
jgi:hypothetical protein